VSSVTTRPATEADASFLFAVYASTREAELAAVAWTPAEIDAFLRMQFAAQDRSFRASFPNAEFLVVDVDDQPAGRLYLSRSIEKIVVVDIALLPAHRGQGVGESLMGAVLAEARRRGVPVRLHVDITNPRAEAFYRRLGFHVVADEGFYRAMAS
jgi:ribosomal protein S18 acetylase RimI-like enzyme